MNYEKICELLEGIVESEFEHIQEFREMDFSEKDKEQQQLNKILEEIKDKLVETLSEEQKYILDELDCAYANMWINICKFYLKEGIAAGLTNLKFLEKINSVGSYFR